MDDVSGTEDDGQDTIRATLRDLAIVFPPPANPVRTGAANEWADIEQRLGLVYPPDFKVFIAMYGATHFDNALYILSPIGFTHPDKEWAEWYDVIDAILDGYRARHKDELAQFPYPAYPYPGGLFPWGQGMDTEALFWLTEGPPDRWPVVLSDAYEGVIRYDMTMTDVLLGNLKGEISLPYLSPLRT